MGSGHAVKENADSKHTCIVTASGLRWCVAVSYAFRRTAPFPRNELRRCEIVDGWLSGDLPGAYDCLAPDGSEIRLLGTFDKGSLARCTLEADTCSAPVRLRIAGGPPDVICQTRTPAA